MLRDDFRFFIIKGCQLITGIAFSPEQLVKLCMDCLGIPVLGPLDKKRHQPDRTGGRTVPTKGIGAAQQPETRIHQYNDERSGMGCDDPEAGEGGTDHNVGNAAEAVPFSPQAPALPAPPEAA
jgi:hypothetical protein